MAKDISDFKNSVNEVKRVTAIGLAKDLLNLAPEAIKFKKRLLLDESEPSYLRLANANDILDRSIAKPSQQVNLNAQVVQANMTNRELAAIIQNRIVNMGLDEVENA